MWTAIRQLFWYWRGVVITVPTVTVAIVGIRMLGLLQPLEFRLLDQFFLLRPAAPIDTRIVVVDITEQDVQRQGRWPMSDATLAQLLRTIQRQKPAMVGLDLYRDLIVEPGQAELKQVVQAMPNLIGVRKVIAQQGDAGVRPFQLLPSSQIGANDLLLDVDGRVRRGLLYLSDDHDETVFGFGFLLAASYLEQRGIKPQVTAAGQVQLGEVTFPAFQPNDGAYAWADAEGYQTLINYRGGMDRFLVVSMTDVLEQRFAPELMRDRIVLIGASAESLKDLFYVPYSGNLTTPIYMPGVTIHANVTSQILSAVLDGRPPTLWVWDELAEWLWILAWTTVGAVLSWQHRYAGNTRRRRWTFLSNGLAATVLVGISYGAFLQGWWLPFVPAFLGLTGSAIAIASYMARSAADMRRTFGRYLTDEVVSRLLETPTGLTLGGERRQVTVLISDLRGFSAISERLPPEQVVTILNGYLGVMADIITQYQGTINEFMGDGIFVMFGAPIARADDSERAVACAIAMQRAMSQVNDNNRRMGFPTLEMGIGIHTGEVVVGNIGSQRRAKYTVIGNHVNLAARIESYTVGQQILISESTAQDVGDLLQTNLQMQVEPKGIREPITLFDVQGIAGPYNLSMPQHAEQWVPLSQPLPLRYVVLEGKHVVGTVFDGWLVSLSEEGAELRSAQVLTPLSNLKLNLVSAAAPLEADLYAKVLVRPAEQDNCVRLRFTGMPPELSAYFEQLRQGH